MQKVFYQTTTTPLFSAKNMKPWRFWLHHQRPLKKRHRAGRLSLDHDLKPLHFGLGMFFCGLASLARLATSKSRSCVKCLPLETSGKINQKKLSQSKKQPLNPSSQNFTSCVSFFGPGSIKRCVDEALLLKVAWHCGLRCSEEKGPSSAMAGPSLVYMGVSKNSGKTTQNGWFIRENPIIQWMIWGFSHPYFWFNTGASYFFFWEISCPGTLLILIDRDQTLQTNVATSFRKAKKEPFWPILLLWAWIVCSYWTIHSGAIDRHLNRTKYLLDLQGSKMTRGHQTLLIKGKNNGVSTNGSYPSPKKT